MGKGKYRMLLPPEKGPLSEMWCEGRYASRLISHGYTVFTSFHLPYDLTDRASPVTGSC